MDNNDEIKLPTFINLTKKPDSSLEIVVSYDGFFDKFSLQATGRSLFQNQQEYLLVTISTIFGITVMALLVILSIICVIYFISPLNVRDVIIKLFGLSTINFFINHVSKCVVFTGIICFGIVGFSSLKLSNKIFLKISHEGVNITSDQSERGSIFIEKRNIQDIVIKEHENKGTIFYNIVLYCYNSILLPLTKISKKEIFLISNIKDVKDSFFRKNEFKNGVQYIKQEIKNTLQI